MRVSDYRGFGIKKRYWFGGRVRPAFMEPLIEGGCVVDRGAGVGVGGGAGVVDLKLMPDYAHDWRKRDAAGRCDDSGGGGGHMKRSSSVSLSSFPLKDDAGYIGYLTDDDESGSGSGHDEEGFVMNVVRSRRRELLRTDADVSFSGCLFIMITAVGLLFLFLFAVSPWGVPPPRRL